MAVSKEAEQMPFSTLINFSNSGFKFSKKEKFEVGNPVQVTEISEAGLVMNYYRAITIGSFRRFILWFPVEIGPG